MVKNNLIEISLATPVDRNKIYQLRHEVYASELMQHPTNEAMMFEDKLDHLLQILKVLLQRQHSQTQSLDMLVL